MAAIRYAKGLFDDNTRYIVHRFQNRSEWLTGRNELKGVGGSDSAAVIGMNPWRTNRDLWLIKTGRKTAPDISNNSAVKYGQRAEEYIRRIFQLDTEDTFEVNYLENCILQNRDKPFMLYSPDGLLHEKATGKNGILEVKTSTLLSALAKERWNERIPENYYCQILHGMAVTGFDFAILRAQLKYSDDLTYVRTYRIDRDEVADDIAAIEKGVEDFWKNYVEPDIEPPLILRNL